MRTTFQGHCSIILRRSLENSPLAPFLCTADLPLAMPPDFLIGNINHVMASAPGHLRLARFALCSEEF